MANSTLHADTVLKIDLKALCHNWRYICSQAPQAETSAVVKANGYGLGAVEVALALYEEGCRRFFVAMMDEALAVREVLGPDVFISVFNGVRSGQQHLFKQFGLTPILNTALEVKGWFEWAKRQETSPTPILHIDTGMNRLGVSLKEAREISEQGHEFSYIMSHLACVSDDGHPLTNKQHTNMQTAKSYFPNTPVSFASSTAVLKHPEFAYDLIRPGVHMYGSKQAVDAGHDIRPVISLTSQVISLREIEEEGVVGYGGTYAVKPGARIAILPMGYADGYLRHLSNMGKVAYNGHILPLAGRVSMDLIAVDASDCPDLQEGEVVELIGPAISLDQVAEDAGTIAYEILTSLGARYKRVYIR